ncbi:MAG: sensor histidine kinase [Propionibacteriaceae bacterium]
MRTVNPIGAALLGLLAGLLLGVLIGIIIRARPDHDPEAGFATDPVLVPEPVVQVLEVLRSSAVVVGPHDEVLQTSAQARTFGLVRGSRVAEQQLLELVRRVRADREIRTAEIELRRGPSSATLQLSARVAPLGEEMILVLAEDQTAVRRVENTRRDFVANVSHELKTPIGAISLLSEAVEAGADDPDAVRRFAGRMHTEAQRLNALVAQIIQLSRLQADDPLLSADEVEIDDVLAAALDRSQVDAQQREVTLTAAGERDLRVLGNEMQLVTAVGNLVENAIIYSDPGARVTVAANRVAESDDANVEITISDNGIGISAAEMDRIFERFYRVDYARSRANGGTGLGLSIVKHVAASHGGQVSVWSQSGQGSTFTIRIPEHLHSPADSALHPVGNASTGGFEPAPASPGHQQEASE